MCSRMLDFCCPLNFLTIKLVNHDSNRNAYLIFLLLSLNLPGLREQNHVTASCEKALACVGYCCNDDSNLLHINLFLKLNCQNEFCQSVHSCERFLTLRRMRMAMKYVPKFGFTASFSLCFSQSAQRAFKLFLMPGLGDHREWFGLDGTLKIF